MMPRFQITDNLIMGYSLSRAEALRMNVFTARMEGAIGGASGDKAADQVVKDSQALGSATWDYDVNDVLRQGMRMNPIMVDQDYYETANNKSKFLLRSYLEWAADVWSNQHLKYTGTIQTIGIQDPITVGENLEFHDFVFHIEGVDHNYLVAQNGLTIFRSNLTLTQGIHKSNDLEAALNLISQDPTMASYPVFSTVKIGITKETNYPTILNKQ
jgi:hypothetical protein